MAATELNKKVGRKAPSKETLRRLFALSGNQCARPNCLTVLLSADGALVGEAAHIAAESPQGPRFDASLSEDARRGFDNLILLCATCHTEIDKMPVKFPVALLRKWKRNREARFEAAGDILRKAYLNEIIDESEIVGMGLPSTLARYAAFIEKRETSTFIDADTPSEIGEYVEKLRHLKMTDRQLMVAIIEKAIVLGGARDDEYGISVHPDDLKTITVNGRRLSDYAMAKLGKTLERNNLGSLDPDGDDTRFFIGTIHIDMAWSELKIFAQENGATLSTFLIDLKFHLLD